MRGKGIPDAVVLGALVLAGFGLARWQTAQRNDGRVDALSSIARAIVNPGARALSQAAQVATDIGSAIVGGSRLRAQNARLREVAAAGETYAADVARLQQEVGQLRKLGGWMAAPGRQKIPADVIGYFPLEDRITLNVGARQGVKRGMPVATGEGLIGRVEVADSMTCQVLLITSPAPESRISALVERAPPNPPPAGLIRGETPNSLRLELADPTATVESGDTVVTSGFSEVIPRGIVIGRIVAVQDDPAFGKRTATVFPRVSLGEIREVVVLK